MKLLTWNISLPEECGGSDEQGPAEVTAYVLDWSADGPPKARPAVIICPGGGYGHLSSREGEPVAMEYLSMGYHVFILRYSVAPARFPTALRQLALLTAQIREHSREWSVNPKKIVVSGFSAGGHLACSLGVFWNRSFVYGPLGRAPEAVKPDGMILSYPVITSGPLCHQGSFENLLGEEASDQEKRKQVSLEEQAGPHTPPAFLWHTVADDAVPVETSILFARALMRHGVSVECHLFPVGCHGLSLANEDTAAGKEYMVEPRCQSWIWLAGEWLKNL